MPATSDSGRLALAKAKFSRVAQELDRLSKDIDTEHGGPAVLKPRGSLQQTAGNMYSVRYSLQQPKEAQLALTFIIIGEDADLLLLQGQEQSGLRDARSDPGQVDQRGTA